MLKYISAHMEIQYDGESDEQFRERVRRMREHNAVVDVELAKWAPAPMKGLSKWDCCCTQVQAESCEHEWCPRLFDSSSR